MTLKPSTVLMIWCKSLLVVKQLVSLVGVTTQVVILIPQMSLLKALKRKMKSILKKAQLILKPMMMQSTLIMMALLKMDLHH